MWKHQPRTPQWARHLAVRLWEMLDHLHKHARTLDMTVDEVKAQLDALVAKATANDSAVDSIKVLIEGLKTTVDDLKAQVAALQAQIDAGQTVDLSTLQGGLDALSATLDDEATKEAALLNTPAAP